MRGDTGIHNKFRINEEGMLCCGLSYTELGIILPVFQDYGYAYPPLWTGKERNSFRDTVRRQVSHTQRGRGKEWGRVG